MYRTTPLIIPALFIAVVGSARADGNPQPAGGPTADSAIATEQEYARALRDNDADAVGRVLADDWQVVNTDGGWSAAKAPFLDVIRSGQFARKTMEISDIKVRLYGNVAVVTEHVSTSGVFKSKAQAFDVKEVQSDVLVWSDGVWKSVLTHETKVSR